MTAGANSKMVQFHCGSAPIIKVLSMLFSGNYIPLMLYISLLTI